MTTPKKKVLITGASGLIGGLVLKGPGDKYEFSALNLRSVEGDCKRPRRRFGLRCNPAGFWRH